MITQKKKTNLFAAALISGFFPLLPFSPVSAQSYGITVAGIEVNAENAADVTKEGGRVAYDHATRTLTLDNAVIEYGMPKLLDIGVAKDTLTIALKGNNTLTGEGFVVFSDTHLRFTGQGSLTIENGSIAVTMAHYKNLIIDGGCTINCQGRLYGLTTWEGGGELTVNASTLKAEGPGYGSLCDFGQIMLEGCRIQEPEGAVIAQKGYTDGTAVELVALDGGVCKQPVVIAPGNTSVPTLQAPAATVEGHKGFARILLPHTASTPVRCNVFAASGLPVATTSLSNASTDIRLQPGLYMVCIEGETTKIVVE
ncbi:MAG: hypothetical protein PUH24_05620 [Prevotellaceae bacterium]|nr:hypothetical protein [Prevotella sp.]MDD7257732.1 hypothetical protein [Prevotellaceae bacterium]MDY6130620.1 hypothetical protein [Prevotella sp.]